MLALAIDDGFYLEHNMTNDPRDSSQSAIIAEYVTVVVRMCSPWTC